MTDRCNQHDEHTKQLAELGKTVSVHEEKHENAKDERREMKKHLVSMDTKLDDLPDKINAGKKDLSGRQMIALIGVIMALIELVSKMVGQ